MKRIVSLILTVSILASMLFVVDISASKKEGNDFYNEKTTFLNNVINGEIPDRITLDGIEYVLDFGSYKVNSCDKSLSGEVIIRSSIDFDEDIHIPVLSIGSQAFSDCSEITRITIPSGIESIEELAFYCCFNLTTADLPENLVSLGGGAFGYCRSLSEINIPKGIKRLESIALAYMDWLDGVERMGTFEGCTSLKNIYIPENITRIDVDTFSGCTGLESMTVSENNEIYHSDGNCIIDTEAKSIVAGCKNSIIPTDGSVTSIGKYAFAGCSELKSMIIPDCVTDIGVAAFYHCTGLESVAIPFDMDHLSGSVFEGCKNLKSVNIPDNLQYINDGLFANCNSLESIVIPISVTSIFEEAFSRCYNLKTVTYKGTKEQWNKIVITEW